MKSIKKSTSIIMAILLFFTMLSGLMAPSAVVYADDFGTIPEDGEISFTVMGEEKTEYSFTVKDLNGDFVDSTYIGETPKNTKTTSDSITLSKGTYYLDASADSGIPYTFRINYGKETPPAADPIEIQLDEKKEFSSSDGSEVIFKFTPPNTLMYKIALTGSEEELYKQIYDAEGQIVGKQSVYGTAGDYFRYCQLEKGKTYYLHFAGSDSSAFSGAVEITKAWAIVDLDANGGNFGYSSKDPTRLITVSSERILPGETITTVPKNQNPILQFAGWYTAPEGGEHFTKSPTDSMTLYAHWSSEHTVLKENNINRVGGGKDGGWYQFTPSLSNQYEFIISDSTCHPAISIYREDGTEIGSCTAGDGKYKLNYLIELNADQTYYVKFSKTDQYGMATFYYDARIINWDLRNPVTGVALDRTEAVLEKGKTLQLTETIQPTEFRVLDYSVDWTSSNENVAKVDTNGKVTAVDYGTADITVTTFDGSKTAVCKITVGCKEHTAGTPVKENVKEATCESAGSYTEVVYCTTCGAEISRTEKTIAKKDHTPEVIPAVKATCTHTGLTEGSKCSVCGKILVEQEIIPATDHNYGTPTYTWSSDNKTVTAKMVCNNDASHVVTETVKVKETVTKEAACEKAGEKTYTATFTNTAFATQTKTEPISALGHQWSEWKVTREATETEEGEETRTCQRCGKTETRKIEKLKPTSQWKTEGVDANFTGIAEALDGTRYYLVNGEVATNSPTLVDYQGKTYFLMNGVVNEDCTKTLQDGTMDRFTDVDKNAWYYSSVIYAVSYKNSAGIPLLGGYEGGLKFGPADKLTRGQFATILHRFEDSPETEFVAGKFKDIADDNVFYAKSAIWASNNGYIMGYGDGSVFGGNDPITREQLATILFRYAKLKGYDISVKGNMSQFQDASKVSDWAQEGVEWAIGTGIISGKVDAKTGTKTIDPQGYTARAECAAMMERLIRFIGK